MPDRVAPFLDRLRSFSRSAPLASFREQARRRFFGECLEPEPEDEEQFDDYVLHEYRDDGGRSLVDHLIAARGEELADAERDAFQALTRSIYGFFKIEAVRRGEGLELRRIGTEQRYSVVEVSASQTLTRGAGLIGRIVPYGDRHELVGVTQFYTPDACYGIERLIARHGDKALVELCDPIRLCEARERARRSGPRRTPPATRFEAELDAADVFSRVKYPLTVEAVQERFQSMSNCMDLLKDDQSSPQFANDAELQTFVDVLRHLWNHTPRGDLDGLSPHEKHLQGPGKGFHSPPEHVLADFMEEVMAKIDTEDFPDDESRRHAFNQEFSRWVVTEQKELDGLAPIEVYGMGSIPPLPRDEELPDADVPLWSREDLDRWGASHATSPEAAIWALELLHDRHEELSLEDLFALPGADNPRIVRRALDLLACGRSGDRAEIASAVARELERFAALAEGLLHEGLDVISFFDPAPHLERFVEYLSHESTHVRQAAIRGIAGSSSSARVGELLLPLIEDGRVPHEEWNELAAAIVQSADVDSISRATELLIENLRANKDYDSFELGPYLERWVADLDALHHVHDALFHEDYDSPGTRSEPPDDEERARAFSLSDDVGASRRFRELFLPELDRVFRAADAREYESLTGMFLELTRRAAEYAIQEDPSFADPARRMMTFMEAIDEPSFRRLSARHQQSLTALFALFFALVLGGRVPAGDPSASGNGPRSDEHVIKRCTGGDWLDWESIQYFAETLSPDSLSSLAESDDDAVRSNALSLLAANDPERFLDRALDDTASISSHDVVQAACRLRGDLVLPLLFRRAVKSTDLDSEWRLAGIAAEILGTRRALAYFRRYFGLLAVDPGAVPAPSVVSMGVLARDPAWADEIILALSDGRLDLRGAAKFSSERKDLKINLRALMDVTESDGDADALVDEGIERFEKVTGERAILGSPDSPDSPDVMDRGWTEPANSWSGDPRPVTETIVRESPKVGRNDPCPCGSGKKYNKCCGKA